MKRLPLLARLLGAGLLGGLLVGSAEALVLAFSGRVPGEADLFLELTLRAEALGLLLVLGLAFPALLPPAARRGAAGAVLLLAVAGAAFALLTGRVSSASPRAVSLFFLGATACGAGCTALLVPSAWKRPMLPLTLLLAAAPGLLAWVDPLRLRGVYAPLDLALLGLSLAAGTGGAFLALARFPKTALATLLVALLVPGLWSLGEGRGGVVTRIGIASPRWALLQSSLFERFLPAAGEERVAPIAADPEALFAPPEAPTRTRDRWLQRRGGRPARSVLWVTIDALRPDETGAGGGGNTPHLDRLAKRGVTFANAFAQVPSTFGSVHSMFRSLYPGSPYVDEEASRRSGDRQGIAPVSLILKRRGFLTAMVTGVPSAKLQTPMFRGMDRGFEKVLVPSGATDAMESAEQVKKVFDRAGDRRVFCWVHLFDPHAPYEPREGVAPGAAPRELYRSEVRHADRALGAMIEALEKAGLREDTVIVVHADHAEAFNEHGFYYHGTSYFDAQIHVPLVIAAPGVNAGRVAAPVGNVDIVPTLMDLLDLPRPPHAEGSSLLPVLLDPELAHPQAAFAETLEIGPREHWSFPRIRMATDGRWKLIHYIDDDLLLLFDRSADPGERHDRTSEHPREAGRLLGWMHALDVHLGRAASLAARGAGRGANALVEDLRSGEPARIARALLLLIREEPHALVPELEAALPSFAPEVRHQVLVVLDTLLMPGKPSRRGEVRLPERPGPLRFRRLLRLARDPVPARAAPLAAFVPANGHEKLALLELRAARGEGEARRALLRLAPPSRVLWWETALVLAQSGEATGADILLNRLRDPRATWVEILRALRSLARAPGPFLADGVRARWPAITRQLPRRIEARVVGLALSRPEPDRLPALLALHPGAAPPERRSILAALPRVAPGWSAASFERTAEAWMNARFLEPREEAGRVLAAALDQAPAGSDLSFLRMEARRLAARTIRDLEDARVIVRVENVGRGPLEEREGPPRVTLINKGPRPLATGPFALDRIVLTWKGTNEIPAAVLHLPRDVLAPGESRTHALPMDFPRDPGIHTLQAATPKSHAEGSRTRPLEATAFPAAPVQEVPDLRTWNARLIPRLWRATYPNLPLRPLEEAAGLEQLAGFPNPITSPLLHLEPGSHRLSITCTAWTEADRPLSLALQVQDGPTLPLGTLSHGRKTTLSCTFETKARSSRHLTLRWSPEAALVEIESITLTRP